jgi:hypothetical protein
MGRKFESQSNNYDKRTINRLRLLVCAVCKKPARQQSVPHYDTQRAKTTSGVDAVAGNAGAPPPTCRGI